MADPILVYALDKQHRYERQAEEVRLARTQIPAWRRRLATWLRNTASRLEPGIERLGTLEQAS